MPNRKQKSEGTKRELQTMRLQENLASIRKIAGWTAEELGDMIGVTKQTISNLETGNAKMTVTQYIAIRAILDDEIVSNPDNVVLPQVLEMLLDRDKFLEGKEYDAFKESVKATAASASAGTSGAVLGGIFAGAMSAVGIVALAALPLAGPFVAGTAIFAGVSTWIKIAKNNGKTKGKK